MSEEIDSTMGDEAAERMDAAAGIEPVNPDTGNLKATDIKVPETSDMEDVRSAQTPEGYSISDDPANDRSVFEITDDSAVDAYHQGVKSGDQRHWSRHAVTNQLKKHVNDNSKATQIFVKIGDEYNRVR